MVKMALSSVVILMVLMTSMLQVDGSYVFPQLYPLHETLESALMTKETLFTMRQVFFPVVRSSAQETHQVYIIVCVEITIDPAMNSTVKDSCNLNADKPGSSSSNNVSFKCWKFQWTDSALLSVITIDQLLAFDMLTSIVYQAATGQYNAGYINVSIPVVCSVPPNVSDIKTSLMLLLSWSKAYARHHGVPPQWEESDKGYIQELYDRYYVAESTYNEKDIHLIRLGMTVSFTLLNILVLIGVLSFGKKCYKKVHQIASRSTRLVAVTWAFMMTALIMNSLYLVGTLYGLVSPKRPYPRIWLCVISEADWCASVESTNLYSDVVASLLVKLTVVPLTIAVELIAAVRLTSHTLLPFPCSTETTPQCYSFRYGKRVIETILIWNVMAFVQIIFGVVLLPLGMLIVIAPVMTFSCISTAGVLLPFSLTVFIAYSILQWCTPISFKHCCSVSTYVHIFTTVVIVSLSAVAVTLYYFVILLGVEPWSVKGSILSLLPSFLVTPLLWFAKRYFFKRDKMTEEVEQDGFSMIVHNQSTAHAENIEEEEEEDDDVNEERKLISVV